MNVSRIEEGQVLEMEFPAEDGTATVTAEVLGPTEEDRPDGWMFRIEKVEHDGQDKTEKWLEKAFDGERIRGAPMEKLEEMSIRCVGGRVGDGDTVRMPMGADE